MLSERDVGEICERLCLPAADVCGVVYRRDAVDCGDTVITYRHIDIELSYGEFVEMDEQTDLFAFICGLYGFDRLRETEDEVVLYENTPEA